MAWWHLENLGPYEAEVTDSELQYGGYGPFDTAEEAWLDWREKTDPNFEWACPWSPFLVIVKSEEVDMHQSYRRRRETRGIRALTVVAAILFLLTSVLLASYARTPTFDGRSGQYCLVRNGLTTDTCVTLVPR